jgi:hypothetical protein
MSSKRKAGHEDEPELKRALDEVKRLKQELQELKAKQATVRTFFFSTETALEIVSVVHRVF